MSVINLSKGQTINLSKTNETISLSKGQSGTLTKIHVGLGWDVHNDVQADLDAFIVQVDNEGKLIETIYYSQLKSQDRAIIHMGDNLTGEGEGDDEVIKIDLLKLNPRTKKLYVAVNSYAKRVPFSKIDNAFVRILNDHTSTELMTYSLSKDQGHNYSLVLGQLIKNDDATWSFEATGLSTTDGTIAEVVKRITSGKVQTSNPTQSDSNSASSQQQEPERKGLLGRLFGK